MALTLPDFRPKVFELHLAREILAATVLVLAAFLGLFAFFDVIHELPSVGRGNYQLRHAAAYVALTLPGRVYELMPIAVLIGTLYALTVLGRHSEITVLRASGLSTRQLLAALFKLGAAIALVTFIFGEIIAPPAEREAQQLKLQAQSTVVAQEFRSGLWVKDELSFVNVQQVMPDASLRGVRIYAFDAAYQLRSISEAESGTFVPPDRWRFANVVQTLFDDERARVQTSGELVWRSSLSPDILTVLMVMPERMSLVNLFLYIRHLDENRQKTGRYEIALWKKVLYPFAVLVMMALALPFGYMQDRMGGVSVKVFAGIMLGITFQLLNGLFSSLGVINSWTPLIAAMTPSAIFLLAAWGMIWWVERR
jgi:lipopolysaccharide export system permease protein